MTKVDFKKSLRHLYQPLRDDFVLVEVPPMRFLMVDGAGDPNTAPAYQQALEALYALAYKLKFASKKTLEKDYVVPPLEGLWWAEDMQVFTASEDKDEWLWTMMIMQPDWITEALFEDVRAQVGADKDLPALSRTRLEVYDEGLSLQILHIGSYADEGPTLRRLHQEVLPARGFETNGKHHEIYLGDPRRVAPEKLRTILRQPVKKAR